VPAAPRSWRLLVAACVAATTLLVPGTAAAHLKLETVQPDSGTPLRSAPEEVVLTFSADIGDGLTEVRVIEPDGSVRPVRPEIDGRVARVGMPTTMPAGTWQVEWRAIGADGHPRRDSRTFDIGRASDVERFDVRRWERVGLVVRVALIGALLLFVGGGAFSLVVARGWRPAGWGAMALTMALGGLVELVAASAIDGRRSILGAIAPWSWPAVAADDPTRGYLIAVVAAGVAWWFGRGALAPSSWKHRRGRQPWRLVVALAIVPSALVLAGHAPSSELAPLRVAFDWIHVVAAAIWVGGLVQLLALTRGSRARTAPAAGAIERYSRLALIAVSAVVVTGATAAIIELDGPGSLTSTAYGRLVLAKVLLLCAAIPLARRNQRRHVPAILRGAGDAVGELRRFVRWELVIAALIVLATAALVHETPPRESTSSTTTHAGHRPGS
jgi:copper transport protein